MNSAERTPAQLGYRMPAEWAPHAGTWMAWPYNLQTWEGHLEGAEEGFAKIIAALTRYEEVYLLVLNDSVRARAEKKLKATGAVRSNVKMFEVESGDVWIRDYGPVFIKGLKDAIAYTKWGYNAYGKPEEYADLLIGSKVPDKLPLENFERFETGLIFEGGSIDVNGDGTALTTESCLLSQTRNPQLSREGVEQALRDYLGIEKTLWLSEGIEGDDTTGHVDDLARFVNETTVVTAIEEDPNDSNYAPLLENRRRLECMTDVRGRSLAVVTLPMPRPIIVSGRRMAATYLNFYIANGLVLVPTYGDPSDATALDTLRRCFPGREVVGVDCRAIIWGYGSIHCCTQQQPK